MSSVIENGKRVVYHNGNRYEFSNFKSSDEEGMLIEKNNCNMGGWIYPNFEYGNNLSSEYLIELALEFEDE